MIEKNEQSIDYDHPVAYDINGRPLYARPADDEHVQKPKSEKIVKKSDGVKAKHDKSKNIFPDIDLSDGEYVIKLLKRHPIGLVPPFSMGVLIIALAFSILFNYDVILHMFGFDSKSIDVATVTLPVLMIVILVIIGTYTSYYVYVNNKFFLTNESIFQTIQTSLFSKREQTISLGRIEDASYTQIGILQQLLGYGSIRLSTIGDENTYGLSYVTKPKEQINILNSAVDSYKKEHGFEKR